MCLLAMAVLSLTGCQSVAPFSESDEPSTEEAPRADEMPARPFYVQVGSAESRADAEQTWQQVVAWWEATDAPPEPLRRYAEAPVRVVWQAPLYRVRVGPMASRDEANAVRDVLRSRFESAFIARGTP